MIDVAWQFLVFLFRLALSNWLTILASIGIIYYLLRQYTEFSLKSLLKGISERFKHLRGLKKNELGKSLWESTKRAVLLLPLASLVFLTNLSIRIIFSLPFVKNGRRRFDKEMKPFLAFKTWKSWAGMGIVFSIVALLLVNYLVTLVRGIVAYVSAMIIDRSMDASFPFNVLSWRNFFNIKVFSVAPLLSVPLFALGLFVAWRSAWVNFEQYRDYNANEEGDDRFATEKEIKRQYKKIPNKSQTYPGEGGFPVLHTRRHNLEGFTLGTKMLWANRSLGNFLLNSERVLGGLSTPSGDYYIEDEPMNVLGIGMTRSGKGEGSITTDIDINSRAEKKPSMIIGDPKGEHYQASYKTMRKRGYNVQVLSYQNMDFSMSYNPLALAIEAAKKGYHEKAQTRVNAVSEAHYPKTKGGDKGNSEYFRKSSISLFNAIVMALFDRAHEAYQNGELDAWDTVTIRNDAKYLTSLGSETVLVDSVGEIVENPEPGQALTKKSKLTVYFDNLRKINQIQYSKFREMADMEFRTSDFGEGETKGNVYSSMMTGINLYLQDNLAKMTSKNSIDLESVGFPRRMSVRFRSSTQENIENQYAYQTAIITISSKNKWGAKVLEKTYVDSQKALVDELGYINFVIEPKLPDKFTVIINFDVESNNTSIRQDSYTFSAEKVYQKKDKVIKLDEYTKERVLDHIEIKEVSSTKPNHLMSKEDIDFIYSEKPTIIYLVTPPHRTEYNALISLFLDQLFNANYELALSNGRKCINRILHILDEFTNLPFIPNIDQKVSIGLGQNILYHIWIQNREQLENVYGREIAMTIRNNCSLEVYIKSKGSTNKEFSEELGNKTITSRRRSANIIDEANPNVSVDHKRQDLLTASQLSKLQEGEAIIFRGVKNRDQSGRKVTPDPIFLHDKTALPYRYMFLTEEFDQSMTLADIPVESAHRGLNLKDIEIDPKEALKNLIQWRYDLESRMVANPKLATRYKTGTTTSSSGGKVYTNEEDFYQDMIDQVMQEPTVANSLSNPFEDDDILFSDEVM